MGLAEEDNFAVDVESGLVVVITRDELSMPNDRNIIERLFPFSIRNRPFIGATSV